MMDQDLHETIIDFINNFKSMHCNEIEDLFLHGYCYYFSIILIERFKSNIRDHVKTQAMYYVPIYNHFITKLNNRYYDISGEVTDNDILRLAERWNKYKYDDVLQSNRIIRDCIRKEKV